MTRLRRCRTVLVALTAGLVMAACGAEAEVPLEGDPAEMLRTAVERAEGTVRLRVHATTDAEVVVATESAEGIVQPDGDFDVTITRGFEFPDGEGVGALGSRLAALEGTTEVVAVDGTTYRTLPEDGTTGGPTLPPGVQWVADRDGRAVSVADLEGYLATRGILDLVADAASVEDAGPTEVDGEPARWLKAVASEQGPLADTVGAGTTIDVAVDGDGRIRRLAFVPESDDGFRTQVIVDIHAYDVDEAVSPPPASETIDRAELGSTEQPTP